MSYREVQPHHNPAVGFTPRRGYRRMNPVAAFSPRPRQHPYIRRFSFQTSGNLLTDMENRWISRSWGLRIFQADFHSGDRIIVTVSRSYERLERDFRIHPGVTLPVGAEYEFNRFGLQLSSATHRRLAVTSSVEGGEFFSGHRTEVGVGAGLRARRGLLIDLRSEWNRINLPEGRFETRLYRGVVNSQFGPWISIVNNIQYDSVSAVLGWQGRIRWILRPGNDLYFVYTHNWQDDPLDRLVTLERRAASKISYTKRF